MLITDPRRTAGRPLLETVRAALDAGLPAVQFRDKTLPDAEAEPLVSALREATLARGALLFVNGRPELAQRVGADGLHLGDGVPLTPSWPGPVSVSAHDRTGLDRAHEMGAAFALLSPLFPTRSHPERHALGLRRFRELAAASPVPVLALGGITPANAGEARAAGAQGVACIDAILAAGDPGRAVAEFLAAREGG